MRKTNELRLGNWVSNVNDVPMIVKAIYEDTIYVDFKGNVGGLWEFNKYEPFKPIQLTEEILLKCDCYWVRYIENVDGKFFFQYFDLEIELPYLHTFQNLYFALTNEELNINL